MIPQLPPELLYHIFSYLITLPTPSYNTPTRRPTTGRSTLATLVRVNSTFAQIAEPLLWKDLDVKSRFDGIEISNTVGKRSELVDWVETLRLRTNETIGPPHEYLTSRLIDKFVRIRDLRVEQPWFGLSLLGRNLANLRSLYLLDSYLPADKEKLDLSSRPTLASLQYLALSIHALCKFINLHYESDCHSEPIPTFAHITTLSIRSSDHHRTSYAFLLPARIPSPEIVERSHLLRIFPKLETISCDLSLQPLSSGLVPKHVDLKTKATNRLRVMWRISWQSFVDYMEPWRSFAAMPHNDAFNNNGDESYEKNLSTLSTIKHLVINPLPYSPIPSHFLLELSHRISRDPSLHLLETIWLETKWGRTVGAMEREKREVWEKVLGDVGVQVRFVDLERVHVGGWEKIVDEEFEREMSRIEMMEDEVG